MKLYTVSKEGIYRHEIIGIFSTTELAIKCADDSLKTDTYHSFQVRGFDLDNTHEDDGEFIYLAERVREMKEIPFEVIEKTEDK